MNLLIPYIPILNHPDPYFEEFTYGDANARGRKLRDEVKKGDYIFFHTTLSGRKFITAYYIVEKVLEIPRIIEDDSLMCKFRNPHITEYVAGKHRDVPNNVVLFGNPISSRKLDKPLLFDKRLANKLSLNIRFKKGKTDSQIIGSATRAWRELSNKDVTALLKAVSDNEKRSINASTLLSTEEVGELLERDVEAFIERNVSVFGKSLKLLHRQLETPVGRIDLLYEDKAGHPIVVELKLNRIGHDALSQLRRYMVWVKKETSKPVQGILVGNGVMPAFEDEFRKLRDVRIFNYGWHLKLRQWP